MFCTILHNLQSPTNVGTIVRSHVAFGGNQVVFVGHDHPWRFKKSTQAFSRRLERRCDITYLNSDDDLFDWCHSHHYSPIAIEIKEHATPLADFCFPEKPALIVGHEGTGLPYSLLQRCTATAFIPQFGDAACLNVATSAAIAMYELRRTDNAHREIAGSKFWVPPDRRVGT